MASDRPSPKPGIGKGVLDAKRGASKFDVARFFPPEDLAPFVEHFWTVSWDLRGQPPFVQETLPHPSVHVVLEPGRSEIVGVITGKFERTLQGTGRVFAARFLPGGFFAVLGQPVQTLTDRRVPLSTVFTELDVRALEREVFDKNDPAAMVEPLAAVIRRTQPQPDPMVQRVGQWVAQIQDDRSLTSVTALAGSCGHSVRTLQRDFGRYVGASPKWVIRRCRLHEVAETLGEGQTVDFAALAQQLGYADQAHFVRDFRDLVGTTPAAYVKRVADRG